MAIQVMAFRHNAEKTTAKKMHDAICAGRACASVLEWNPQTRKISTSFPLRKSPTSSVVLPLGRKGDALLNTKNE